MKKTLPPLLLVMLAAALPQTLFAAREPWLATDTEHFTIVFKEENRAAAEETVSFCEDVYGLVTAFYGSYPPHITVVLQGRTDYANGYFEDLPPHILIYVTAPGDPLLGYKLESWLRMCLVHELTHLVHLSYRHGIIHAFSRVFGPGLYLLNSVLLPGWMIEGVTTTGETRFTGGGRGRNPFFELLFKAPIVEDSFFTYPQTFYSSIFPPSGRHYVAGYLLVDHIEDRFGSGATERIHSSYSNNPILGIAPAVKSETGMNPDTVFLEMKRSLEERYRSSAAVPLGRVITPAVVADFTAPVPTDRGIYLYRSALDCPAGIVSLDPDTGAIEPLLTAALIDDFSLTATSDGNTIYFASYRSDLRRRGDGEDECIADIYRYDRRTGVTDAVTRGKRLWQPAVSRDGGLLAAVQGRGAYSALVLVDQRTGETSDLFVPDRGTVYTPSVSPDGSMIAFTLTIGGYQDLWILERRGSGPEGREGGTGETGRGWGFAASVHREWTARQLTGPDYPGEFFPVFAPDGAIIYSSDRDGSLSLYRVGSHQTLDEAEEEPVRILRDRIGVVSGFLAGETLFYQSYSSLGWCVRSGEYRRETIEAPGRIGPYPPLPPAAPIAARPFKDNLRFVNWYPLVDMLIDSSNDLSVSLGAYSMLESILGTHSLYGTLLFPVDRFEPTLSLSYTWSPGIPRFGLTFLETYGILKSGLYSQETEGGIEVVIPLIDGFELDRTTSLSLTSSFICSRYVLSADPFDSSFIQVSAEAVSSYSLLQFIQYGEWSVIGLDSDRDIFDPALFSGLAEWGYAAYLPADVGEGFFVYGTMTGGIPGFFRNSTLRLSASGAFREADIVGTRFIAYRGLFDEKAQTLRGEFFVSVDYLFTLAVFDLPLLLGFNLQGIGAGLFCEFRADWDAAAFTPDDRIHAGVFLTPLLGYLRVVFPFSAGVVFRIPYADIRDFDPSADIGLYFRMNTSDIETYSRASARIR